MIKSIVVGLMLGVLGLCVLSTVDSTVTACQTVTEAVVNENAQSAEPLGGGCYCCIYCQYPQTGCCQMCCPR